MHMMGVNVT